MKKISTLFLLLSCMILTVNAQTDNLPAKVGKCGDSLLYYLFPKDSVLLIKNCRTGKSDKMGAFVPAITKTAIKTLYIEGVDTIPASAFQNCTKLDSVILSASVDTIGGSAFAGCTALRSFTCMNLNTPKLGTNAFNGSPSTGKKAILRVSSASGIIDKYKTGNNIWGGFDSIVANGSSYPANAYSTTDLSDKCGENVFWYNNDSVFTVWGAGKIKADAFNHNINSKIKTVKIETGVTSIGSSAFIGCSKLTSVDIPGSVIKIDEGAFRMCKSLETIIGLTGVKSIGDYAFSGCTSLTGITIPKSVTEIGYSAFSGCNSLKTVTFHNDIEITAIESFTFQDCSSLTSITVPKTVTGIGGYAFDGCSSLKSVTGSESVTAIDNNAFSNCLALESIKLPKVTSINSNIFSNCFSLKSVEIPELISFSYSDIFSNCLALETVKLLKVTSVPASAFSGLTALKTVEIPAATTINQNAFSGCTALESVKLPAATSIGSSAFSGCTALKTVEIPAANYIDIGTSAFESCRSLSSVKLPEGLQAIQSKTFKYCTALKSVDIPKTVEYIGNEAFGYCLNLRTVTDYRQTPQIYSTNNGIHYPISDNIFYGVPLKEATLFVEKGSLEAYKDANVWKSFGNFEMIDPYPGVAFLENLTVSEGTLNPSFRKDIDAYTVDVPYSVTSVTITATPGDIYSTVTGDGVKTGIIAGIDTVFTVVVSKSGAKKDYTVTVRRNPDPAPETVFLQNITLSGSDTLVPKFHRDVLDYTVTVPISVNSVTIGAVRGDTFSTVTGTGAKNIDADLKKFEVTVSKAGGAKRTYNIFFIRDAGDADPFLVNLTVSGGILTPAFHRDSILYSVEVPHGTETVKIGAKAGDIYSTVRATDTAGVKRLSTIYWETDFEVLVSKPGHESKTYTVTVNRNPDPNPSDVFLQSLTVSCADTLSPKFHRDVLDYTVTVPHSVSQVKIGAVCGDEFSTINAADTAGMKTLNPGTNRLEVTVTKTGGTRTYSIFFFRDTDPAPDAVFLENLTVSAGTLKPAFSRTVYDYTVNVHDSVKEVEIRAVAGDKYSTVTGAEKYWLSSGLNRVSVVVSKSPTVRKTYIVDFNRAYPTGIQAAGNLAVKVSAGGNQITVDSPAAERVYVYSVAGKLLHTLEKQAGAVSFAINRPPQVLIVKGGSGWTEKTVSR